MPRKIRQIVVVKQEQNKTEINRNIFTSFF